MEDQRRVVLENSSFLAFVPYAAEVLFEVWIMPKMHQASFSAISDRSKSDLSGVLQELLARLHGKLGDPDYNYVVYTSSRNNENEPQLHWFLQIRPRLTTQAGFEIGSGICINPSLPEAYADFLRQEGS
jgi:UDPglucose--hexose-1-phosphate uridylyltransferase